MMVRWGLTVVLCTVLLYAEASQSSRFQPKKRSRNADQQQALQPAQQAEVDAMVDNLLHWIQGLYQQKSRKARQYFGGKPERPRPFEPASYLPPVGYPPAGSRPTPSYNEGPSASPGYQPSSPSPSQPPYQPSPTDQSPHQPSQLPYIPGKPSQQSFPASQPTQTYQPSEPSPSPFPSSQSYETSFQPSPSPSYQPNQPSSQSYQPSSPSSPSYQPSQPSSPSYQPSQSSSPSYHPSQPESSYPGSPSTQPAYQPNQETYRPSQPGYQPSQPTSSPYEPSQPQIPDETTLPPYETPQQESQTDLNRPDVNNNAASPSLSTDDDDRHPPHIHAITVDCGKEMMTINIEFNKAYNGIIYSQDHYNDEECVYVRENSNQIKYSFTVSLNTCGTRFFSDFENEGQAYLENVLVLQNEPGIQEVWDHIRRVRCLWEGNLTKQLVSSLSVGMLNQITSNFSGDTAMARLDIQTGKGPFAPEANGLIKIGETMTLVVSVTGDAGFDIFVRECIARDANSRHVVPLTDSNGCVLKPKLFGAFQKTRETGNTGASIIAYAYFNAFKFPDEMDLIIQCDVELCKTDCEACPNPGSTEPRRRRRDIIHIGNRTLDPVTTIEKGLRVVFAEDLPQNPGFCISQLAAMWGGFLVLAGSLISSLAVTICWQRSRGSMKFT